MAAMADPPESLRRRPVVAWTLYDFANSTYIAVIPGTMYAAYYTRAVVGNEQGRGDFWWGLAITTSMAIVALCSPPLGAIADYAGVRKRFLAVLTYASVLATGLMATVGPGDVVWGFLLTVVATVGYEGAIVYYNAYLPELAPPHLTGRLSAYGFAVGYAGSMVGLACALPFARPEQLWVAFLITAVLYGLFALPALLWLPADRAGALSVVEAVRVGFTESQATLRRIFRMPDLRTFLLAYLFFEDGVNTVVFFSSVFASQTLGFELRELLLLFLIVQVSALGGAWLWARPTDIRGPRFVVMLTLVQWCLVVVSAYFVQTKAQFWVVAVLAGTGLGAVQSASRALMARLIPRGQEASLFGFYSLCGKTSAVVGPMIFGGISAATGGNQRAAILAVGVMFVVGLVLLSRLRAGGPAVAVDAQPGDSA
jgi:UMF1 family MFS transporter